MTLANLALFAISVSQQHSQKIAANPESAAYREAAYQEGETLRFQPDEPKASRIVKLALVLNLPAVFCGIVVCGIFGSGSDTAILGFTEAFVPLLWYPIGRWVDQQLLLSMSAPTRASKFGVIKQNVLRALSAFLLVVMLLEFTPLYHHRTSETEFLSATVILWCAPYLVCSFWGERRLKKNMLRTV
jgi:hypothetical protein